MMGGGATGATKRARNLNVVLGYEIYEQSNPSPQVRVYYIFLLRLHVPRPFLDIDTTTDHTRWP